MPHVISLVITASKPFTDEELMAYMSLPPERRQAVLTQASEDVVKMIKNEFDNPEAVEANAKVWVEEVQKP